MFADAAGTFSAYRLPRGQHGLAPELVAENQRWRLLGAAAELLAERGYARITSSAVARWAGVSSSTFYQHFDDIDECLLAAYEVAAECVLGVASDACAKGDDWPVRLRAAIDAVLEFLAAEPALAHLLGAEGPAGVNAIAAARERLLDRLAQLLRSGRGDPGRATSDLPDNVERRLLAGAFAVLSDRIRAGGFAKSAGLAPQLAGILASPYANRS